ncbi:MAG: M28 family metallopeptidase [Candidatus Acidiferrales bacterium]
MLVWIIAPLTATVVPAEQRRGGSRAQDPSDAALAVITPEAIRAHMSFLADDLLEGRGTGTRGYELAAHYVASQFEQMGLAPAGANGTYYQPVPLRRIELDAERSWLELVRKGKAERLVLGRDFAAPGHEVHTDTRAEAPVVFVGFGVTAPELGYDDYAGIDVRGKIVAMFSNAPAKFASSERAHFSSRDLKAANAARRGAVGMLVLWTEKEEKRFPWAQLTRILRKPGYRWLDAQGMPNDAQPQLRAGGVLSLEQSRALFAGATKSYEQAAADAEQSRAQAFALQVTARMRRVSRHESVSSPNVAAVLRGSDAKLREEYVVYTAHLDHEGIGEPRDGDAIYNGALDNASGIAQMLEAARAFARLPKPPRRSVVFVAVAAEEEGLLGSEYYANFPTVPARAIVANVNLDGGLILYPGDAVVHGADHSSMGAVAEAAAKRLGIVLSPDPAPEENFFVRSDQYSFIKKGVPAVFVFPGMKSSAPEIDGQARFLEYLAERYHTPLDDMSQPFSFEAGALGARFNFLIGYAVAQQTERPRWNEGDFFGETFASNKTR